VTSLPRTLTFAAVLLSTCVALQAQNTISPNTGVVFLNATVGGGPVSQPVTVTSAPSALILVTPSTTAPWLTFAANSPNTPTTITFIANPAGLAAGVYNTTVNLTSPSAGTQQVVAVLTVNAASPLASNPPTLFFSYAQGGAIPAAQSLQLTSATPVSYTVKGSANWQLFGGSNGTTPGAVTVGVDPSSLSPGAPNVGFVTITPTNGQPPLLVPIVFYVSASPTLNASPNSLTFNYQIGGTSNVTQKTLTVTSTGSALGFNALASVANGTGTQWLTVSPTVASTPATVTVTVTPGSLPPGIYQGTIILSSAGSANQNITVTLNVSAQPLLDLSANALNFSYQIGGTLPADQFITPNATSSNLNYTIGVATNNSGNWLLASGNGVTPGPVRVSIDPTVVSALGPGNYTGTLTFNAINGGNNPQVVNVTLTVSNNPTLSVNPSSLVFNFETGQAAPPPQTVQVTSTTGALTFSVSSNITTTSNGVTWLLVNAGNNSISTPGSFTVGAAPAGMAPGTYTGTIVLTAPGITNPNPAPGCTGTVCIPVTLNVSNTALLSANPTSLTFTGQLGTAPAPQTVTIASTGEPVTYTVAGAVTTPAGGSWLTVGAPSGPAAAGVPSNFFVGVTPTALSAGTYKGSITVHPSNGNPDVVIPVTMAVTSGNLTVSPTTLNFQQAVGGSAPQSQTINISSTGAVLQFTAVPTAANWLTVNPNSGFTPGQVAVSVNGGSLAPGTYTAQVNVVSPTAGNSPQAVTVNLTVGQGNNLTLAPAALAFSSQFGSGAPASQTTNLTLAQGTGTFTATAAVSSPAGGSWLSVTPSSGTASQTNTPLTISVNPAGLNPGTYNGTVTVSAAGATNSPQTLNVTYTVNASGTGGGNTRVLPQYAFGGGWYTALYFTNTTSAPVSFQVNIIGDNGQPLSVPALGGSSITVNLAPRGSAILEAPNTGNLQQGYVLASLPVGVFGYGVFRQTLPTGVPDQEAVVQFSSGTATTSTLLFDETKYVNGVAIVNDGASDVIVTVTARDNNGNSLGVGSISIPKGQKVEAALRDIQGMAAVVGKMGSVDFSSPSPSLAALGIRFNGPAFTSVPTTDR
jgi:hypothetical protein